MTWWMYGLCCTGMWLSVVIVLLLRLFYSLLENTGEDTYDGYGNS